MSWQAVSWWLAHAPVKGSAWQVGVVLAEHADEHGAGACPSKATIAAKANLGDKAVDRALKDLVAGGHVTRAAELSRYGTRTYAVVMDDDRWPAKALPALRALTSRSQDPRSEGPPVVSTPGQGTERPPVTDAVDPGSQGPPEPPVEEPKEDPPSDARAQRPWGAAQIEKRLTAWRCLVDPEQLNEALREYPHRDPLAVCEQLKAIHDDSGIRKPIGALRHVLRELPESPRGRRREPTGEERRTVAAAVETMCAGDPQVAVRWYGACVVAVATSDDRLVVAAPGADFIGRREVAAFVDALGGRPVDLVPMTEARAA